MEKFDTQSTTDNERWYAEICAIDWRSPVYLGCLSQVARAFGRYGQHGRVWAWKRVHRDRNPIVMQTLLSAARAAERGERELQQFVGEVAR